MTNEIGPEEDLINKHHIRWGASIFVHARLQHPGGLKMILINNFPNPWLSQPHTTLY